MLQEVAGKAPPHQLSSVSMGDFLGGERNEGRRGGGGTEGWPFRWGRPGGWEESRSSNNARSKPLFPCCVAPIWDAAVHSDLHLLNGRCRSKQPNQAFVPLPHGKLLLPPNLTSAGLKGTFSIWKRPVTAETTLYTTKYIVPVQEVRIQLFDYQDPVCITLTLAGCCFLSPSWMFSLVHFTTRSSQ